MRYIYLYQKQNFFFNIDNLLILSISSIIIFFFIDLYKEINLLIFSFKLMNEIKWQMEI